MDFGNISTYGNLKDNSGNLLPYKVYDASGNLYADFGWTGNKTITLTTSDTQTTIANKMYQYGKYIPFGSTLTIQCPSGTMAFTGTLTFANFFGGGTLYLKGDGSNSLHINQTSVITTTTNGIYFSNNDVNITMNGIKLQGGSSSTYLVYFINCWKNASLNGCYIRTTSKTNQNAITYNTVNMGAVETTYFGNVSKDIFAQYTKIASINNSNYSGDTYADYGLYVSSVGELFKTGSQPTGCLTANETKVSGGQIFV